MDIHDLKYDISSSSFIINGEKFKIFAHKNELLKEHIKKTNLVFNKLVNHGLISNFYNYFFKVAWINVSFNEFLEIINKFIEFHDMGKISFNFQINRVNKKNHDLRDWQYDLLESNDLNHYIDSMEVKHSLISALLFIVYFFENKSTSFLKDNILILAFAYSIYSHHSSLKDVNSQEGFIEDISFDSCTFSTLTLFSEFIFNKFYDYDDFQIQRHLSNKLNKLNNSKFSSFYSYIYSLLISSDYIASNYFDTSINGKLLNKWDNRIDSVLKNKMMNNWANVSYNKNLNEYENTFIFHNNFKNINDLRKSMLLEASFNLRKSLQYNPLNKIFYLNMPTGGGKTNTSMKLALDIVDKTDIDRIIYAIPFVNIIEQNYDNICNNYGLDENLGEIRKIYSGSETIYDAKSDEFISEIIMKDDFFDFPVICTTFVSLFNSIIRNKKKYKYKLQALSNSVIILDEVQTLNLKNWNSLYYLINEISNNFNIYFILMSATLPKFDELKINVDEKFDYTTVNLLDNSESYFNHSLFERNKIISKTDLDLNDKIKCKEYFKNIFIENFKINFNKGLIVLNTIKNSAYIYKILEEFKEELNFDYDLLNSTFLPSLKNEIIYKINHMDNNKKYILISTQSIEAGVDVSFDFVIRDFTCLDSIEQVRGRCNRSRELNERFNNENVKGNVYLTEIYSNKHSSYEYIYDDLEINTKIVETKSILSNNLNYSNKDIFNYYDLISLNINKIYDLNEENFILSDRKNISYWNLAHFSSLNKKDIGIHIIQNKLKQYSCFVEAKIKVVVDDFKDKFNFEIMDLNEIKSLYQRNEKFFIFSLNELIFIKDMDCSNLIEGNYINGKALLQYYNKMRKELSSESYKKVKILQKEWSSILNKFIFNVTLTKEDLIDELDSLKKVNYFYVIPEEKVGDSEFDLYSLKKGFNYYPSIVKIL